MTFVPSKKSTLLIPSGETNHLFVILTDACSQHQHLLVSFSTIRQECFHDPSCIVTEGEHPFIKRPSFLAYNHARTELHSHLVKCVSGWTFRPHAPVTDDLFEKICRGLIESDHTPNRIKKYYQEQQT